MYKIRTLFIVVLGFLAPTYAQVNNSVIENALLWKVSGHELSEPSYLYGTIHMICKEQIVLSDSVRKKFMEANKVFFEGYKKHQFAPEFDSSDLMQRKSLQRLVGKKYFEKIRLLLSHSSYYRHIDETTLNKVKPLTVNKWIGNIALGCKTSSYEDTLWRLALDTQKPIDVLERKMPPGFSHIDDMPLYIQAERLIQALDSMNTITRYRLQSIAFYGAQNIVAAYNSVIVNERGQRNPFANMTLDQRNKKWIPIMEKAMKKQSTFFAFGCAHLAGANGILHLLREKGYTVEPVMY